MDIRERIIEHLKREYKPIAIILHGSRSSQYFTPRSDWDFWVLTESEVDSEVKNIDGQLLDVAFVKYPLKEGVSKTFGGTLQNAEVLFDTEGKGEALLKSAKEIYQKGRNLTLEERENRLNFIARRLKKMEDNIDNPGVFFFHLGIFYDRALRYWFEIKRNSWSEHPAPGLQTIKHSDPEYFSLLEVIFSENPTPKKLDLSRRIVSSLQKKN